MLSSSVSRKITHIARKTNERQIYITRHRTSYPTSFAISKTCKHLTNPIMRFSLALATVYISLAAALPTKRELVAPFNNDAGEGLIPSVGQTVDTLFNVGGGLVAEGVRSGAGSDGVNKRELVAPGNNDAGEGLIPSVGQAVDTGFDAVGGLVAEGVRSGAGSGEASKRELVAPGNNDAGEGLIPSVGQTVDALFDVGGGLVAEGVRSGAGSDAE
jgi:hypothetical protein